MAKLEKFDAKINYEEIYKAYGLKVETDIKGKSHKRTLRRHLKKHFGERTWYDLSEQEKRIFIYVKEKDYMLNTVIPEMNIAKKTEITDTINKVIEDSMIDKTDIIKTNSELLNKRFYDKEKYDACTDEKAKQKEIRHDYKEFAEALKQLHPQIIVPTLEQWIKDNQKKPLSINDYELYPILNPNSETGKRKPYIQTDTDIPAPQQHVDHLILLTIVKILKECQIADIDVDKIEKCTSVIHNFLECPIHPMIFEYDPTLNMSKEMQEEYITECKNYALYNSMCENLDFYELLGKYKEDAKKKR